MVADQIRPPPPELVTFARRLVSELAYDKKNRREDRHHFAVAVEVQSLDDDRQPDGEPFVAVTRDLSGSGLGLLVSQHLRAKFVQVIFTTKEGRKPLTIEVLRCRALGRFYDVGGRFVE